MNSDIELNLKNEFLSILVEKHIDKLNAKQLKKLVISLLMDESKRIELASMIGTTHTEMANILNMSVRQFRREIVKYKISTKNT